MVKKLLSLVMAVVVSFMFALPASAQSMDDILKRLETLEKENASLKSEVMTLKEKQVAQDTKIAAVQATPLATGTAPSGNFLKTKPEIELYGFIKADAVLSSNDMGGGNNGIAQYSATRRSATGGDDRESQLSAQDTRLGLKFKAPDLDNGGKLTGQFEMDFAGTATSTLASSFAGNYVPRLRLAFVNLDFDKWAVNAGQNWDIFAPLNPSTLNPGILYRGGNLGTRHPQVTLINKWGEVPGGKLTTKIGLVDGDDSLSEDSGVPAAAAYVGYDTKILGVKSCFGLGGLFGRLNLPGKGTGNRNVYATTAGVTLTFTDWLSLKSEGFGGVGLNKFMGGPAQTTANATPVASSTTSKPLQIAGGFVELTYNPIKKVEMNFGVGIDKVNEDMTGLDAGTVTAGLWKRNQTYYTNVKYSLSKDLLVGLELQEYDTTYPDAVLGSSKAHDQRIESSIIYKF